MCCSHIHNTCIICQALLNVSDCVWNVMAHAQKPDFIFWRNGRVHLNRRGASVHSTTGSRGVRISGSNASYTMLRGIVKGTGYPLHSPVSPSLPLPCVTMCHHISTELYRLMWRWPKLRDGWERGVIKLSRSKVRPSVNYPFEVSSYDTVHSLGIAFNWRNDPDIRLSCTFRVTS